MANKRQGGRPTRYDPKMMPVLGRWMARCGLTDEEMAKEFGVTRRTLAGWKGRYPEFAEALSEGKEYPDALVEDSLLRRALGYEYEEVHRVQTVVGDEGEEAPTPVVEVKTVTKQVVPDVTAQIFWLKNRQPDRWRDVKNHEHTGKDGGPIHIVDDIPRE